MYLSMHSMPCNEPYSLGAFSTHCLTKMSKNRNLDSALIIKHNGGRVSTLLRPGIGGGMDGQLVYEIKGALYTRRLVAGHILP
jgi:hypothetical protein